MKRSFVLLFSLLLLTALFAGFSRDSQLSPSQTVKKFLDSGESDTELWDTHLFLSTFYGSYWNGLTNEQKNKMADIYSRYMVSLSKMRTIRSFIMGERITNETAEVDAKLFEEGKTPEINTYELYNKNGKWLIYNVKTSDIDLFALSKQNSNALENLEKILGGADSVIEFLERILINGENREVVIKEMASNNLHQKVPKKKK